MAQLHVKIFMGGDVRRRTLTAPFTFESLRAAVASVSAVPNAKIHFVDDDGDLVLIESDSEFVEARRCAPTPDTLHVGVGPDGAASLASASQLKKLGSSVNTSSSTNTSSARPPREQSPKPRAVVSAPPTPAAPVAAPVAAPAEERNLKQLVEAAVQEALRGTLPHLQASMRQVDDAERRRVAALEQQLADVKQQLTESISMVSSMRVQQPQPPPQPQSFVAREQQVIDEQLAEALRLSREEAKRAEAKAVADKIRASREEAAKQAAEAAARAQQERSQSQAQSPLSAAAPLFESLFVNRDGAGSATVDIGALLAAVAGSKDASLLLPFVRRFLQHPNDQAAVDELSNKLYAAYAAASGARAASPAEARGGIQQALRYVQQRPHVREFLAELIESAPLGALLRLLSVPAAGAAPSAKPAPLNDQSLIASYRDDVKSGRVVCDECSTVIRGARFKCTTCADFDLCAPCEAKTQHNPEHALLKVRLGAAAAAADATPAATPDAAPAAKPDEELLVSIPLDDKPAVDPAESTTSVADSDQQAAAHAKLRGYRAALVRDVTLPDGARVRPGASLTKVWRLQNSGSAAWPIGSTLGFVGGSDFRAVPTAIPDGVEPGAMIDVTLRCTAPERAGRYIGYWRLIDPRGAPYGERIWLDVDVDGGAESAAPAAAPPAVAAAAAVVAASNPASSESWTALAKAMEAAQEKERVAKEKEERERREAEQERARREADARREELERARREAEQLEQARALATAQLQKQKAAADAAAAVDRQYGEKLRQLAAMGFTGDRVRVLIVKHGGNVLNVVQELLEDASGV